MTRLPIELQFLIIDVHKRDFHQLRSISPVCKIWRFHCNRTLFRRLLLSPSSIVRFAALISSSFSRQAILEHASHLWLDKHDDDSRDWDAPLLSVLQGVLVILRDAPDLTELILLKSVPTCLHLGLPTILLLRLTYIQTLHLSDIHFDDPEGFFIFFANFSTIRSIVLRDVSVPGTWASAPMLHAEDWGESGSRFTISLRYNKSGMLRRCFRWKRVDSGIGIRARDVAMLYSASAVGRAEGGLPLGGQGLSCIEILGQLTPRHAFWESLTLERIDLSSAFNLEYLTIGSSGCVLSLMPWVPSLLSRVPDEASIKELRIAFASSRQFNLDRPFIRWLANTIIGRRPFQNLKSICFMAFGTLGEPNIEEKICQILITEFGGFADLIRFSFSP